VSRTARDETVEDEIGKNTQNEGHKKDRPPPPADGEPKDQKQKRRDNEKDHGCWAGPATITSHQSTVNVRVRVSVWSAVKGFTSLLQAAIAELQLSPHTLARNSTGNSRK
jgi:hypothetical protein